MISHDMPYCPMKSTHLDLVLHRHLAKLGHLRPAKRRLCRWGSHWNQLETKECWDSWSSIYIYVYIYICTLYIYVHYIYMYIIYICTLYIYVYIVKHCWFQNSNHISRISRLWVHEMWDAQKVAGALGFVQLGVRLWSICPQPKVMAGRWPESSSKSGSNSFWEFLSFLSFVVFFWFCLYYVCAFACARTLGKASICNLLHEASMPKWIINHFWLSYSTRT